jgi:hypothetical protein
MDIEICFINGVSLGIELAEMDKTFLCIDLLIIRILFSKNTDEDNNYMD